MIIAERGGRNTGLGLARGRRGAVHVISMKIEICCSSSFFLVVMKNLKRPFTPV
jgi:hypothetical protein